MSSERFAVEELALPGAKLITPRVFHDQRGYLVERWRSDEHARLAGGRPFVQDNLSRSLRGVLRGLHFQRPPADHGKLVGVTRGRIYDVAVDLRLGSPSYRQWVGVELDDEKLQLLWVPRGFAHGFLTLSEEADVLYKLDGPHSPDHEAGVRFDDPDLAVDWSGPLARAGLTAPLLSARDAGLPSAAASRPGFEYRP